LQNVQHGQDHVIFLSKKTAPASAGAAFITKFDPGLPLGYMVVSTTKFFWCGGAIFGTISVLAC
jgi:hypothetical protein